MSAAKRTVYTVHAPQGAQLPHKTTPPLLLSGEAYVKPHLISVSLTIFDLFSCWFAFALDCV